MTHFEGCAAGRKIFVPHYLPCLPSASHMHEAATRSRRFLSSMASYEIQVASKLDSSDFAQIANAAFDVDPIIRYMKGTLSPAAIQAYQTRRCRWPLSMMFRWLDA